MNNKIITIVIAVVLLLILGVGGYWLTKMMSNDQLFGNELQLTDTNSDQDNEVISTINKLPVQNTNNAIPIADQVPEGWKTHITEDKDYSFAYRNDWTVEEAWGQYTRIIHKDFKLEIARQTKAQDQSLEDYANHHAEDPDWGAVVTDRKWIQVDNLPALSQNNSWIGGAFKGHVVYVEKDGYVYHLVFRTSHTESDVSNADIETFLDYFKFIDKERVSEKLK